MEEKPINISVDLSMQDYQKSLKLGSLNASIAFYSFIICGIIINIGLREMVSVAYLILSFIVFEIWTRMTIKKKYKLNKLVSKEKIYNFTENGIETHAVDGSLNSIIKWDEIYAIKQSKDIMIFLIEEAAGLLITKRSFNVAQFAALEGLLENKLSPKALKKTNYIKFICLGSLGYIIIISSIGGLQIAMDHVFK